ncbi:MAG: TetR family transcriptional regulator, partial [Pseudomonadota bacterium]
MRERLIETAITIIADYGLSALTHRRLAEEAACSLALTTYYFPKKADIVSSVSQDVLEGYLGGFDRVAQRYKQGRNVPRDLWVFSTRVIRASAGPYRQRTMAWAEIYLDGIRRAETRALVRNWMHELQLSWKRIAAMVEPDFNQEL